MKQLLLPVFLLLSAAAVSQTGPAGVGTNDGSGALSLWLDAGKVSATDGATVTSWLDGSGKGNNTTQGPGAVLHKTLVNGKSAFSFNGTSQYFQIPYTANLNPATFTIFAVSRVVSSTTVDRALISSRSSNPGAGGYSLYASLTNNDWTFATGKTGGNYDKLTAGSTAGSWAGQTIRYQGGTNGKRLYVSRQTITQSTSSMPQNTKRPLRIGAGLTESDTPGAYFQGDIAEVIVFGSYLNTTQRYLIKNYLSAKYGYTINTNNIYLQDENGNFDTDVAGIGQVSATDNHTDSRGTGSVRIRNARGLGDNEFLMWGHNNATKGGTVTTDVPTGIDARFSRVWRVSQRNGDGTGSVDVGAVDLSVDLTGFTGYTADNLRLLIDTNNDGFFTLETPIAGAVDLGDNVYEFRGVADLTDGRRFTFATINVATQDGPGGVGICNATSSLKLWLDADRLVGADGTPISTWEDRSGKGKDFTAGSGAVLKTTGATAAPSCTSTAAATTSSGPLTGT